MLIWLDFYKILNQVSCWFLGQTAPDRPVENAGVVDMSPVPMDSALPGVGPSWPLWRSLPFVPLNSSQIRTNFPSYRDISREKEPFNVIGGLDSMKINVNGVNWRELMQLVTLKLNWNIVWWCFNKVLVSDFQWRPPFCVNWWNWCQQGSATGWRADGSAHGATRGCVTPLKC